MQMHPHIAAALDVLRNESGLENWYTFSVKLDTLIRKTITIGLPADRLLLDGIQYRGVQLLRASAPPDRVLRVFTEMLPNDRNVAPAILARDREALKSLNKMAVKNFGSGGGAVQAAAAQGGLHCGVFYYACPQVSNWGPLTLPLSAPLPFQIASTAPAQGAARAPRKAGRGGGRQQGGGASAQPPAKPPAKPTAKQMQERDDYNKALNARQQALTFDP